MGMLQLLVLSAVSGPHGLGLLQLPLVADNTTPLTFALWCKFLFRAYALGVQPHSVVQWQPWNGVVCKWYAMFVVSNHSKVHAVTTVHEVTRSAQFIVKDPCEV